MSSEIIPGVAYYVIIIMMIFNMSTSYFHKWSSQKKELGFTIKLSVFLTFFDSQMSK